MSIEDKVIKRIKKYKNRKKILRESADNREIQREIDEQLSK